MPATPTDKKTSSGNNVNGLFLPQAYSIKILLYSNCFKSPFNPFQHSYCIRLPDMSSPEDNFWVTVEGGRRVGLGTTNCGGQGSKWQFLHDTSQSFSSKTSLIGSLDKYFLMPQGVRHTTYHKVGSYLKYYKLQFTI